MSIVLWDLSGLQCGQESENTAVYVEASLNLLLLLIGIYPFLRLFNFLFTSSQDIVKTLLSKGADVNARDKDDITPLMEASIMDHADVVR